MFGDSIKRGGGDNFDRKKKETMAGLSAALMEAEAQNSAGKKVKVTGMKKSKLEKLGKFFER